jgi:hypothetical protein
MSTVADAIKFVRFEKAPPPNIMLQQEHDEREECSFTRKTQKLHDGSLEFLSGGWRFTGEIL